MLDASASPAPNSSRRSTSEVSAGSPAATRSPGRSGPTVVLATVLGASLRPWWSRRSRCWPPGRRSCRCARRRPGPAAPGPSRRPSGLTTQPLVPVSNVPFGTCSAAEAVGCAHDARGAAGQAVRTARPAADAGAACERFGGACVSRGASISAVRGAVLCRRGGMTEQGGILSSRLRGELSGSGGSCPAACDAASPQVACATGTLVPPLLPSDFANVLSRAGQDSASRTDGAPAGARSDPRG